MNSKLILAKNIKMDRNYNNVLNYTENQMLALLEENKVADMMIDLSYVNKRNKNTINVPLEYSKCLQANYIGFQNLNYSNKWFFAWIDEVIFLQGEPRHSTQITFTIDNFSTWFSKVTPKACYVEREHVNDDTIGANIVDENLDVGDMIEIDEISTNFNKEVVFVIESSFDPFHAEGDTGYGAYAKLLNRGLFANFLFMFPVDFTNISSVDTAKYLHSLENFFWLIQERGKTLDEVKNLYVLPKLCVHEVTSHTFNWVDRNNEQTTFWYDTPDDYFNISYSSINIDKVTSFNNLNIKNNKCFCYPYNYLLVTNNNGNQNIFKYERFLHQTKATFEAWASIQVGASVKLIPNDYNINSLQVETVGNFDEGLSLGKYPVFNWNADAFTNWLTQNGINVATSLFNTFTSSVTKIGTIAEGGLTSTLTDIGSQISEFKKSSLLPSIQGGQNVADVMYSGMKNEFVFKRMRCDNEHIKIIDDYFSRFGYKILEVKVPNITGRTNFNFVKISGSEEIGYGEVPSIAMEDINNAFRKGTTVWHNHTNLGNFNVTNNII